jgi:hypothetical protein
MDWRNGTTFVLLQIISLQIYSVLMFIITDTNKLLGIYFLGLFCLFLRNEDKNLYYTVYIGMSVVEKQQETKDYFIFLLYR